MYYPGIEYQVLNTRYYPGKRKRKMEGHFRGLHSPLGIPFRDIEDYGG